MAKLVKLTVKLLLVVSTIIKVGDAFVASISKIPSNFKNWRYFGSTGTRSVRGDNDLQFLTRQKWIITASTSDIVTDTVPCLSQENLDSLSRDGYVIVSNFLPSSLVTSLRKDVTKLRETSCFRVAKIGQDNTNALNEDIRVAETCFLGREKKDLPPSSSREALYDALDKLRSDLSSSGIGATLDANLSELLYAYYPEGGFYRRHRDAVPGSASVLRSYSLLLYLNEEEWDVSVQGGALRLHLDGGGDELPPGVEPNYLDVSPSGGTLVLFRSDILPHEVLDTRSERAAVVGWYNRVLTASDAVALSGTGEAGPQKSAMLLVAAGLVTAGVLMIVFG